VVTDATSGVSEERIADIEPIGVVPLELADVEAAFYG
jgi:hypothetical protein